MNRDDLDTLLSSGKFLCFKPTMLAPSPIVFDPPPSAARKTKPAPDESATSKEDEVKPGLFDLALLQNSIFFKESAADEVGDFMTETRVMLSFDENDPHQGGVSSAADPDQLLAALGKWYGGRGKIDFSEHDRAVLAVLCRIPTFDPFIMLAYRADLERHRKIHTAYFEVDRPTSDGVRKVIERRAARLVALALRMGDGKDDADVSLPHQAAARDRPEKTQAQSETLQIRQRSITVSLSDAIWTNRLDRQSTSLLHSFRIDEGDMARVLFAWKGISYYEFLFNGLVRDHKDFFRWLGSGESSPRDAHQIAPDMLKRLNSRRARSIRLIRQSYLRCAQVLQRYEDAYDALTLRNDPNPFQHFLLAAPTLFEGLGTNIGRFGHASNAWAAMTNGGRRLRLDYDKLDPFYDFIVSLHRAPIQ